jgi:hypothetical protein
MFDAKNRAFGINATIEVAELIEFIRRYKQRGNRKLLGLGRQNQNAGN